MSWKGDGHFQGVIGCRFTESRLFQNSAAHREAYQVYVIVIKTRGIGHCPRRRSVP